MPEGPHEGTLVDFHGQRLRLLALTRDPLPGAQEAQRTGAHEAQQADAATSLPQSYAAALPSYEDI